MKIKKIIPAFCLAAGLALSISAFAPVSGLGGTTVAAAEIPETDTQETETPVLPDGWYENETGVRYLRDGEPLVGKQKIGSYTYYFNKNGYRVTGPVKTNGNYYYFTPKKVGNTPAGALLKGKTGLITTDKKNYYYLAKSKTGRIAVGQWFTYQGKKFYAAKNGLVKFGTIKVGSKLYHITKNGRLTGYGRSSYDKKYYYASSSGVLKTGLQKINGRLYYFNKKTGQRQTGTVTAGKYTYYFNTQSGYARTGWIRLGPEGDKDVYYYGSNYRQYSGLHTINGKKYYFNPKNSNIRVESNWQKIGKHYYYFGSDGTMQYGFQTIKGKTYFFGLSDGIRKKGWQTVNGLRYFMDKTTAVMKTGWFEYKGDKYYMNPVKKASTYGAAKTGWVKIGSYWYYFNNEGKMQTGWLTLVDSNANVTKYYLNPSTGRMATGTKVISGKTYNFGNSGKIIVSLSGSWTVRVNRKQCCVTIYKGNTPVKAMICSTARDGVSTPTGTFYLRDKLRWHELIGPCWGQYCSHITDDILFHSVTYSQLGNIYSVSSTAYNNLGSPASAGCIRLQVGDAKWMYDNLPVGTKVIISDNEAMPLGKPTISKIPLTQSYDPTDPNI